MSDCENCQKIKDLEKKHDTELVKVKSILSLCETFIKDHKDQLRFNVKDEANA